MSRDPSVRAAARARSAQRVRALYEETAVPVREIARLCGVTERAIYKRVERNGWRRRYGRVALSQAAATDAAALGARRVAERNREARLRTYGLLGAALVDLAQGYDGCGARYLVAAAAMQTGIAREMRALAAVL